MISGCFFLFWKGGWLKLTGWLAETDMRCAYPWTGSARQLMSHFFPQWTGSAATCIQPVRGWAFGTLFLDVCKSWYSRQRCWDFHIVGSGVETFIMMYAHCFGPVAISVWGGQQDHLGLHRWRPHPLPATLPGETHQQGTTGQWEWRSFRWVGFLCEMWMQDTGAVYAAKCFRLGARSCVYAV